ncbi:MAG: DNA-directed RNA polymerase subunit N [Candidatus Bathyarchaeota archaeon]|nr:DNA-directed RNA polymerase subunit N [Candidatus Bathyarchaeota archaeon]MCZ2845081.1 DNA-directed RNA polymerase subunit N [Candidatus Bathyarchaeota archaeon]
MMIPVRCFTCGKVIGDKWEAFKKRVSEGEETKKVLDDLSIERYCCRRIFISHVEVMEELLKYVKNSKNTKNMIT